MTVFRRSWREDLIQGALIGPPALSMAAPEGDKLAMELVNSIGRLAGLLSDARETGILAYSGHS